MTFFVAAGLGARFAPFFPRRGVVAVFGGVFCATGKKLGDFTPAGAEKLLWYGIHQCQTQDARSGGRPTGRQEDQNRRREMRVSGDRRLVGV